MVKVKSTNVTSHKMSSKKKRSNVHSKTRTSKLKTSKNYKKLYRGQGK